MILKSWLCAIGVYIVIFSASKQLLPLELVSDQEHLQLRVSSETSVASLIVGAAVGALTPIDWWFTPCWPPHFYPVCSEQILL